MDSIKASNSNMTQGYWDTKDMPSVLHVLLTTENLQNAAGNKTCVTMILVHMERFIHIIHLLSISNFKKCISFCQASTHSILLYLSHRTQCCDSTGKFRKYPSEEAEGLLFCAQDFFQFRKMPL